VQSVLEKRKAHISKHHTTDGIKSLNTEFDQLNMNTAISPCSQSTLNTPQASYHGFTESLKDQMCVAFDCTARTTP
jgi:hypothetical protein